MIPADEKVTIETIIDPVDDDFINNHDDAGNNEASDDDDDPSIVCDI